jgi:hypothetical protein
VSAEALFCAELTRLKRHVVIKSVQRAALDASLIFLCIWAAVFFIEKAEFTTLSDDAFRYGIPIGVSLTAALLLAVVKRKNLQNILIDIDTRLKLQDRLSTAYEYQRSGKKSNFLTLLLEDATLQLHQLEIRHMVPAKFSAAHLALILLLVLNAALYTGHFWGPNSRSTQADQKHIEKARTLLRNYTQSRIGGRQVKKRSPGHAYARQLEQLTERLDDPALNPDTLFTSLSTLRNELHAERARLAGELGAKLNALMGESVPVQPIPGPGKLSSHKIEKLKTLLKGALNDQIPDSLNQDIETLQEFSSLENLLSQIIDDLKENDLHTDEYAQSQPDKTQTSQHEKDRKKTLGDTQRHETQRGISDRKQDREATAGLPASDQSQDNGGDESDDAGLHDENAISAGRAKSAPRKKSRDELENSTGPGLQDKLSSAKEKEYRIHIRSLSAIGESKLAEENIIQTYRQEIESILQKEEIPLNYRQYIKHYFISIGLKTEAEAYDAK